MLAHEITYKGTVIATATVKGKTTVRISAVNPKTKKPEAMTFQVDAHETKILRGDKVVTFEEAQIQKDEKIAVTIDHDLSETIAYVIRLDARK